MADKNIFGKNIIKKDNDDKGNKNVKLSKDIQYINILGEYNEFAFLYCVNNAYQYLNCNVLDIKDMRKVDLAEKIISNSDIILENTDKVDGSLNLFLLIVKYFFDEVFNIEKGSRADRFRNRGYELIEEATGEKGNHFDIEDVVTIFISLLRTTVNMESDKEQISSFEVGINIEDVDLIHEIKDDKRINLNDLNKKTGLIKSKNDKDIQLIMDVFYTNLIIFLTGALQTRGKFKSSEE